MRYDSAFTVSDAHSAFHYFDLQQIEYETLDSQETVRLRVEISRRIKKLYPWAPLGQIRHGHIWGYLGDYIPKRVWLDGCSTEEFSMAAKKLDDLTIVFENSRVPAFHVDPLTIPNSILISDLIAFGNSSLENIYVMNHEQEGVAAVNEVKAATQSEVRFYSKIYKVERYEPRNTSDAESFLKDHNIEYSVLCRQNTNNLRRFIRRKLSEKLTYFPSRALSQRTHLDWLWNYLPLELSAGDDKKKAAEYFLATSNNILLLFEDRRIPAFMVDARAAIRLAPILNDAYIIDWPEKRWMLALTSDDMYPTRYIWFDW